MPIYEYRCNQCEREFEKYVQGAQTRVGCPACTSERVTRRLSVVGIRSTGGSVAAAPSLSGGGGGRSGCGCRDFAAPGSGAESLRGPCFSHAPCCPFPLLTHR